MGTNFTFCVKCDKLILGTSILYDLNGYGPMCQECYIIHIMKKLEEFLKGETV